jgi:hypothetical protein
MNVSWWLLLVLLSWLQFPLWRMMEETDRDDREIKRDLSRIFLRGRAQSRCDPLFK